MSDLFLQAPRRPSGISLSIAYRIRYQPEEGYYRTISYFNSSHSEGSQLSYTLSSLSRDKVYTIKVSMRVRYSVCSYNYAYGNYSDPVSFRTNATCKLILSLYIGIIINNKVDQYRIGSYYSYYSLWYNTGTFPNSETVQYSCEAGIHLPWS